MCNNQMPMFHLMSFAVLGCELHRGFEINQAIPNDVPFGVLTGAFNHVAAESIEAAIAESDGDAL